MLGNRLSLAIALALHSRNKGFDSMMIQHHFKPRIETVREEADSGPFKYPASGFREESRRAKPELYNRLLDAERQDRGLQPTHAQKPTKD